jgi:succinate dehydrogenase / fumarate reductase cytochrome b subunit
VVSFARVPVSGAYMVAVIAVALHVYHGLWSALQTLGLNRPPTSWWRRGVAAAVALLIAGGYIAIPAAVLAGVVR